MKRRMLPLVGCAVLIGCGIAVSAAELPPSHYEWKGSGDFDPAKLFGDKNEPTEIDVIQQGSPTCYFLAGLFSVVRSGHNPKDFITYAGGNNYDVKLWSHHTKYWDTVRVTYTGNDWKKDPEQKKGSGHWPAVYQRAYLKLCRREVTDESGGTTMHAMRAIKGWTFKDVLCETLTTEQLRDLVVSEWAAKKGIVTCGTYGDDKNRSRYGHSIFVGNHAYSVNSANDKGIEIRNPWGIDINLDRPNVVTKKLIDGKPRLTYLPGHSDSLGDDPTDGYILLPWDEFKRHFVGVTVRDRDAKE